MASTSSQSSPDGAAPFPSLFYPFSSVFSHSRSDLGWVRPRRDRNRPTEPKFKKKQKYKNTSSIFLNLIYIFSTLKNPN